MQVLQWKGLIVGGSVEYQIDGVARAEHMEGRFGHKGGRAVCAQFEGIVLGNFQCRPCTAA